MNMEHSQNDTERKACGSDILATTNPTWNP